MVSAVCVSVSLCLSVPRRIPALVVHYWADLQAVRRFRCHHNIARTRNVSECLLAPCLLILVNKGYHIVYRIVSYTHIIFLHDYLHFLGLGIDLC